MRQRKRKPYATAAEVAERFRVKPATVHSWRRRGLISGVQASRRPVLYDLPEIEAKLRSRGGPGCPQ